MKIFFLILILFVKAASADGYIHFIQYTPMDSDIYMLSTQSTIMQKAFNLAIKEFSTKNKLCNINTTIDIKRGTEEELYNTVKKISKLSGNHVIVGFTRTNYARIAAKAAAGSALVGISAASFSDELRSINHNFISISMPWTEQWKLIKEKFKELNCNRENTFGIFSFKDSISLAFRSAYIRSGYNNEFDVTDFLSIVKSKINLEKFKCVMMGTPLPSSIAPLSYLTSLNWIGSAFGTGDWTYFTPEMKRFLQQSKGRSIRLYSSQVWDSRENARSLRWAKTEFNDLDIDPIHAAVFDSTTLALNKICSGQNILKYNRDKWSKYGLLRDYSGILSSGNLESPIYLKEIR